MWLGKAVQCSTGATPCITHHGGGLADHPAPTTRSVCGMRLMSFVKWVWGVFEVGSHVIT